MGKPEVSIEFWEELGRFLEGYSGSPFTHGEANFWKIARHIINSVIVPRIYGLGPEAEDEREALAHALHTESYGSDKWVEMKTDRKYSAAQEKFRTMAALAIEMIDVRRDVAKQCGQTSADETASRA